MMAGTTREPFQIKPERASDRPPAWWRELTSGLRFWRTFKHVVRAIERQTMPKSVKQHRAAARPQRKGLKVVITLKPELAPLFIFAKSLMRAKDDTRFMEWLIVKGLTCEAVMDRFDGVINKLL